MHLERYYQFESLCNNLITKNNLYKFHSFTPSPIIMEVENDHVGDKTYHPGTYFPPPWEWYHTTVYQNLSPKVHQEHQWWKNEVDGLGNLRTRHDMCR